LDFYKRDELLFSDTEVGKTRDRRAEAGGRNFTSLTAGGTWRQLTATGGLTNNFRATSSCAANGGVVMNGQQAAVAGLTTNAAVASAANTFCTFDQNKQISALPGTQRFGALSRATFELSPTLTGFAELGYSKVETDQTFTAPFFAGTTGLQPIPGSLKPFTYNINFAPGSAGNPFASNAQYAGSLQAVGLRTAKIDSDTVRLLAGLQYSIAGWDFDSAIGRSKNSVTQLNNNRLSIDGVSKTFGIPTTPQPPIPLSTSSSYNLDTSVGNPGALLISFPRKASSELNSFDTKANTTLGELPGGPVGIAVGVDYRAEKLIQPLQPARFWARASPQRMVRATTWPSTASCHCQ
jgi:iron complex outermembrane recepter protein